MKRFFSFLTAALLLAPAGAQDVSGLVKKLGNAVVTVTVLRKGGIGSGTGFFVDRRGHLVTCAHVIKDALSVTITFKGEPGSMSVPARVIASDPLHDLALLAVDSELIDTEFVKLGDSTTLKAGEEVFTIGSPLGLQDSVSTGVVAHPKRGENNLIQTTAVVNPGNSGGPIFNHVGEVIGVVEGIITKDGFFAGCGFAIPSETVKWFLHKYTLGGK